MDETGSMSELERRLRTKAEEDRRRSEQIYLAEFETLFGNLRRRVLEEASSIESAMESLTRPLVAVLRRITLVGVFLGVSLSLGTCGANLALVQWQSSRIESLSEERSRLETKIADQRLTLERLNEKTWGVDLADDEGNRYVMLPKGTLPGDTFEFKGRWVVPISTE